MRATHATDLVRVNRTPSTDCFLGGRLILLASTRLTSFARSVRVNRTEWNMKMDETLLELIERMEVKVNIMEEERRAKAFYALGVEKMNETRGVELA